MAQAVAVAGSRGGRTPEFDALVGAVAGVSGNLMFVGLGLTFFAFVLLVISATRRHWSKLHSAAVVLVTAAVLLGTLLV